MVGRFDVPRWSVWSGLWCSCGSRRVARERSRSRSLSAGTDVTESSSMWVRRVRRLSWRLVAQAQRRLRPGQQAFDLGLEVAPTQPRGVVGFEGVLGALLAAVQGGHGISIHGVLERRHRFL